jgi:hypothetical protein
VRELYGELVHPGEIISVRHIGQLEQGTQVTFRARIHTQRKVSAALDFLHLPRVDELPIELSDPWILHLSSLLLLRGPLLIQGSAL